MNIILISISYSFLVKQILGYIAKRCKYILALSTLYSIRVEMIAKRELLHRGL